MREGEVNELTRHVAKPTERDERELRASMHIGRLERPEVCY